MFDLAIMLVGYVGTSINDGPGCLMLRCPDPSCTAAIGQDMINNFTSDEDKEKYLRYFLRSYIESNKKVNLGAHTDTCSIQFPLLSFLSSKFKIKNC